MKQKQIKFYQFLVEKKKIFEIFHPGFIKTKQICFFFFIYLISKREKKKTKIHQFVT